MLSKIVLFIYIATLISCSIDYKEANETAVDRIYRQIKAERFDEVYEQSSNQLKNQISKNEFIEKMSLAVNQMKEIDDTLNWKKTINEDNFYQDHSIRDTSFRFLKKSAKQIGIFIYWAPDYTLCGFETSEMKVINACS